MREDHPRHIQLAQVATAQGLGGTGNGWLLPFGDGNGRVSRLMMNHVLYRSGHPMMDIKYRDRGSYYNALERSQTGAGGLPFLRWFMGRYLRMHASCL